MIRKRFAKGVEYDTANAKRVYKLLDKSPRGLSIHDIARSLGLNRHTITKILEKMLIEKRVDYDEKGIAKVYFSTGKNKFVGSMTQGKDNILWVNTFKPKYKGEEEFVRINQTKHDWLIRSSSKFKSVGAIAVKKSKLKELIGILKKL